MSVRELWDDEVLRSNLIETAIFVALVIVAQALLLRVVRRARWLEDDERLAWLGRVRLAAGLLLFFGLILVWATELRALALSAVAIAAALVLATKELILCISGGVVRRMSESCQEGDRIELGGARGDVIRLGLFSMTLLEVGPGQQRTGRAIVLPNAMMLSQPVVNESFTQDFVLHVTSVAHVPESGWEEAERSLLAAAVEACGPYLDEARRHMEAKSAEHGLSAPSVEPRVFVQISGKGERTLLVRFPAPAKQRARLEQQMLRAFRMPEVAVADEPAS